MNNNDPPQNGVQHMLNQHGKDAVQITPRNVVPLADAHELVALASSIQSARDFVKCQAIGKLEMIAEQMEFLRKQAVEVLRKAQHDNELHCVECKVKKVPGKVYYLYGGQQQCEATAEKRMPSPRRRRFLSLISPDEWGGSCALGKRGMQFLGAFRLHNDQSWSPVQQQNVATNAYGEEATNYLMTDEHRQKAQIMNYVDTLMLGKRKRRRPLKSRSEKSHN